MGYKCDYKQLHLNTDLKHSFVDTKSLLNWVSTGDHGFANVFQVDGYGPLCREIHWHNQKCQQIPLGVTQALIHEKTNEIRLCRSSLNTTIGQSVHEQQKTYVNALRFLQPSRRKPLGRNVEKFFCIHLSVGSSNVKSI